MDATTARWVAGLIERAHRLDREKQALQLQVEGLQEENRILKVAHLFLTKRIEALGGGKPRQKGDST